MEPVMTMDPWQSGAKNGVAARDEQAQHGKARLSP
jgi:hypothetical protein